MKSRSYHRVTLVGLATTKWTHVEVEGLVSYVRKQADGDIHITLDDGKGTLVVLEIIPTIIPRPLTPKVGQRIRARGISRYDKGHKWHELHPLENWELCPCK